MAEVRHLTHAPIREAVLDVRVRRSEPPVLDALRALANELDGFGNPEMGLHVEAEIGVREGSVITRQDHAEPLGFRVVSDDDTCVLQLRVDGFSYSRLAPYTSWEDIQAHARPLLERYVDAVEQPEAIRLALRYLNHLRLPYPTPDISDFVLGLPALPAGWPETVESFLFRVTLSDQSARSAHVTHALVDDVAEDRIGVIFDIDAFLEGQFIIGNEDFWARFEELRDLKNRIFFSGITERTAEMYA